MKKLLSLILCLALCLSITLPASAAVVDTTVEATASVEPRLNKTVTKTLGNSWTDVWDENNWLTADLTVTNSYTSAYSVIVQIVDPDTGKIIADEQTISCGKSHTFYDLPAGGYTIQAKSVDGVVREYTLYLAD